MDALAGEPRLLATFEMLVERLGGVEAELRAQRRASEYRDDMAEPGMLHGLLDPTSAKPFSLYKGYAGMAQGRVYVVAGCDPLFHDEGGFDHELHRPTLEAAWGADVAARAIDAETGRDGECARCEDFGIEGHQEYVFLAKQEVVLQAAFPLAVDHLSPRGIWLTLWNPTGVRDLLRLLREMAAVLGSKAPDEMCAGEDHLRVYDANHSAKAVRLFMDVTDNNKVFDEPEGLRRVCAAWAGLSRWDKELIRREVDDRRSVVWEVITSADIKKMDGA